MDPDSVFRFVRRHRGLYYDWLNFVSSMGGFDLVQTEGRLTEDVIIDESPTIEATRRFVELARISGQSQTMDEQIKAMSGNEVGSYVGWTDSFRFKRSDGVLSGVSLTPLKDDSRSASARKPQARPAPSGVQDIRLGHSPRDMRQPRRSLVDGWLLLIPKKKDPGHLSRAIAFAKMFLDPDHQRKLLRLGFPSPSAWAIEREIDALHVDRTAAAGEARPRPSDGDAARRLLQREHVEESFEVFLDTMKAAIYSGRWIASPKNKIDQTVTDHIESLIADGRDFDGEMRRLAKSVEDLTNSLIKQDQAGNPGAGPTTGG
jgi:ABC-type glycerol-3-phosphate transport system substrate-binding protein